MAEPTLTLTLTNIRDEVAHYLYGNTAYDDLAAAEKTIVDRRIRDGLARFYGAREWGFLKVWTTLTTVASTSSYDLPDGAGYIEGPLFFPSESGYPEIRTVDAETVHRHWQESLTGGVPMIAALQPKTSAGTAGQKNEIIFWPIPDAEYVLTYKYRILPDALADAAQYALGGSAHSQTIRAACLAEAEMRDNDTIGMYTADYTRLLEQSIAYDARAYAPRSLGRMGNGRLGRRIRTLRPSLTLEVEE